jgi:hypothetical protein
MQTRAWCLRTSVDGGRASHLRVRCLESCLLPPLPGAFELRWMVVRYAAFASDVHGRPLAPPRAEWLKARIPMMTTLTQ